LNFRRKSGSQLSGALSLLFKKGGERGANREVVTTIKKRSFFKDRRKNGTQKGGESVRENFNAIYAEDGDDLNCKSIKKREREGIVLNSIRESEGGSDP